MRARRRQQWTDGPPCIDVALEHEPFQQRAASHPTSPHVISASHLRERLCLCGCEPEVRVRESTAPLPISAARRTCHVAMETHAHLRISCARASVRPAAASRQARDFRLRNLPAPSSLNMNIVFLSTSQVFGWVERLRKGIFYVKWDVRLSLSLSILSKKNVHTG